ncbi:MAG: ABC transporter permease [Oscillospiraceae bacterium]
MDMFINFIVAAVLAGTPLLFGTVGEIIDQKAGHLNLGVEGMMAIGACAGFMAGYRFDSLVIAIIAAFLSGAAAALIYAVLTVTFMADQNVTGLTLTIFGCGLSNFIGEYNITRSETGNLKLPENITAQLRNIHIPVLSDLPVAGKLLFSYNIFIYLGVAIAIIVFIYLSKTKTGLNLRTIGENPAAADAVGIHVVRSKFINLLIGGGICGIGGAYCSMIVCGGVWMSDSVNGMGWISVALVIFAAWSPLKAIGGSLVFGAFSVLKYYMPKSIITLPNAFYDMLPFLITALILVITSIRKNKGRMQPASCGVNYFREER